MFPVIFQSSMGLGKSRCDIPNGSTQEWGVAIKFYQNNAILFFYCVIMLKIH
jgi:hypothetical protein